LTVINIGPPEALILAVVLVCSIGAIVHAARLGRWGMVIIMIFLLPGLWLFWWPLHRREAGFCRGAG
jgi:hypothetical protein